jgi:DNA polymerase III alpha subunit
MQRVDEWGRVILDDPALLEFFYKDLDQTSELYVDDSPAIQQYNQMCQLFDQPQLVLTPVTTPDVSPEDFHRERQKQWLMPPEYQEIDLESWLIQKCSSVDEWDRVKYELELFQKHNMMDVLRLFIYITTELRDHGVLWGVGRGSSVASYCLFLIGIHRIDSIKYGLDIKEFLRDE